jgi:3-isopropylmalate/(R)-2-methylmalate dehydratase small subunit
MLKGRAYKMGDNISTDHIIPGRFFHLRSNLPELAKHVLEDVDPNFRQKINAGDFLVAGKNFGLGSSREHAALVIKIAGVGGILASSVARIFYRNAINIGLPVATCDTHSIGQGDELHIDLGRGVVENVTQGITLAGDKVPQVMLDILAEGGLLSYIRKYGRFRVR